MKHLKSTGVYLPLILLFIAGGCSSSKRITAHQIPFSPQEPDEIKAMTFNVRVDTIIDGFRRWKQRKSAVIDTIADHKADVIGLQEALDRQVEDVSKALPQYAHYAVGRGDGDDKGETCAIFYRRDRFALRDSGTFWFTDTPEKPGRDWGALWPRICSWVHLQQKDTGESFYVYNVHMDALSQRSREKSAKLLAERIAQRKTDDPFIVMGDFNMKLNNSAMKYLHEVGRANPRVAMTDAWRQLNPRGNGDGTRIDHIPLSKEFEAVSVLHDERKVDGRHPSDHYPVIASFRFKQPAYTKADDAKTNDQTQAAATSETADSLL